MAANKRVIRAHQITIRSKAIIMSILVCLMILTVASCASAEGAVATAYSIPAHGPRSIPDGPPQGFHNMFGQCQNASQATDADMKSIRRFQVPTTHTGDCALACIYQQTGQVYSAGDPMNFHHSKYFHFRSLTSNSNRLDSPK